MATPQTDAPAPGKSLRLWPGITAAVLLFVVRFLVPVVIPDSAFFGIMGAMVCALAIFLWWLLFSRVPWPDRLAAIFLTIVVLFVEKRFVDKSISNAGMGMMLPLYGVQVVSVALVVWAVATGRLSHTARRVTMAIAILLACGLFMLVRTGGITGEGDSDLHWRWSQSPEGRVLARGGEAPPLLSSAPTESSALEARPVSQPGGDGPGTSAPSSPDATTAPDVSKDTSKDAGASPAAAKK